MKSNQLASDIESLACGCRVSVEVDMPILQSRNRATSECALRRLVAAAIIRSPIPPPLAWWQCKNGRCKKRTVSNSVHQLIAASRLPWAPLVEFITENRRAARLIGWRSLDANAMQRTKEAHPRVFGTPPNPSAACLRRPTVPSQFRTLGVRRSALRFLGARICHNSRTSPHATHPR